MTQVINTIVYWSGFAITAALSALSMYLSSK